MAELKAATGTWPTGDSGKTRPSALLSVTLLGTSESGTRRRSASTEAISGIVLSAAFISLPVYFVGLATDLRLEYNVCATSGKYKGPAIPAASS
jgi:hypothetical protein